MGCKYVDLIKLIQDILQLPTLKEAVMEFRVT
jgi:hypothetical protein